MAVSTAARPATRAVIPLRGWERLCAALGLVGVGALVWRLLDAADQAVFGGTGSDYVAFATGGRLVSGGDRCLYCRVDQADVQAALLGYRPLGASFPHTFANAPLAAWLLQPLAGRSLADGLRIFELAILLTTVAAVVLAIHLLPGLPRRRAALVAVILVGGLAQAQGLLLAQWDPFLLLALLGGIHLLRGGRPALAGLLLATLAVKPQACLLLIPALLAARSWRAAAGATAGVVCWWGPGVVLAGSHFPVDLAHLLRDGQAAEGSVTAGLPGVVGGVLGTAAVLPAGAVALAAGLLLLVYVRERLRGDPELAVCAGVALSLLAAPHVFSDDLALLVPGLLLLARRVRPGVALLLAGALDLSWLLDERLLPTSPRMLEALATGAVAVTLLTAGHRGAALRPEWLDRVVTLPDRLLEALPG